MRIGFKSSLLSVLAVFFTPALLFAKDAATVSKGELFPNPVFAGLLSLAILLVFVIGVLGNVLMNLAFAYREKLRKEKEGAVLKTAVLFVALILPSFVALAAETEQAASAAVQSSPYIGGILKTEFYALVALIGFELLLILGLLSLVRIMIRLIVAKPELLAKPDVAAVVSKAKKLSFWDRFHNLKPAEQEADLMLDHDYDGIKELDNSLPPWWKYGFYLTILVAFIYMWYYHAGGSGPSSYDEYVAEVQAGEEAKAAYLAKSSDNIDENTVKMGDAGNITAGKTLFAASCAACHAADGGGTVGPNLTDNYWLHGGRISDVFKSIKYGWADKGMKSWKDDFSPKQIADLSSFIKSLNGTTPAAPKEKQGELYTEGADRAAVDSSKVVAVN